MPTSSHQGLSPAARFRLRWMSIHPATWGLNAWCNVFRRICDQVLAKYFLHAHQVCWKRCRPLKLSHHCIPQHASAHDRSWRRKSELHRLVNNENKETARNSCFCSTILISEVLIFSSQMTWEKSVWLENQFCGNCGRTRGNCGASPNYYNCQKIQKIHDTNEVIREADGLL